MCAACKSLHCTCTHKDTLPDILFACLTLCSTCHYPEAKQTAEKERDEMKRERDHLKGTQQYYENIRTAMSLVPAPPAFCDIPSESDVAAAAGCAEDDITNRAAHNLSASVGGEGQKPDAGNSSV